MASNALHAEIRLSIERFQFEAAGLHELLRGPVAADLVKRGIRVENEAKRIASNTPPSAPGQGPGVRTGRLRSSITWRLGQDEISPYVDIGSAVFYAPFLENGTRKMRPRPFLRPALNAARATF